MFGWLMDLILGPAEVELDEMELDPKRLVAELKAHIQSMEEAKVKTIQAIEDIEAGRYSIQVTLTSLWEKEGESPISLIRRDKPFNAILNEAENEFMAINNRSDVQASLRVAVITDNGYHHSTQINTET